MIIFPVIFLIICVAVRFVQLKSSDNEIVDSSNIKLHPVFCVIGYVTSILFLALSVVLYFYSDIWATLVCVIFSLLSDVTILGYYGYRVKYDNKKLIYRKFFGKYKTILFRNIVNIEYGIDLIIRTKDDTLVIPNYALNVKTLYTYLTDRLKLDEEKTQKLVPRVRKFKESVHRPQELIFAFGLLLLLSVFVEGAFVWLYAAGKIVIQEKSVLIFIIGFNVLSGIVLPFYVILAIVSAKRAHSSKKWRKIACLLIKEHYLK